MARWHVRLGLSYAALLVGAWLSCWGEALRLGTASHLELYSLSVGEADAVQPFSALSRILIALSHAAESSLLSRFSLAFNPVAGLRADSRYFKGKITQLQHPLHRSHNRRFVMQIMDRPSFMPGPNDIWASGRLDGELPFWWWQTPEYFHMACKLPDDVSAKRDVSIIFREESISLSIRNVEVLQGLLSYTIMVDESSWYVDSVGDQRYLFVELSKMIPQRHWSRPVLKTDQSDKQSDSTVDGQETHNNEGQDGSEAESIAVESDGLDAETMSSSSSRRETFVQSSFLDTEKLKASLEPRVLEKLDLDNVLVIPHFISPGAVTELNRDHLALRESPPKQDILPGGLETDGGGNRVSFMNQTQLFSNGAAPERDNWAATFLSTQLMPTLMTQLDRLASIKHHPRFRASRFYPKAELAYLHYPVDGYFKYHMDTPEGCEKGPRRAFSFVLFLNDLDEADGGALRLYKPLPYNVQQKRAGGGGFNVSEAISPLMDVRPRAGTLVLFRSDAIPHQVLRVHAPRDVLVGWIYREV